MLSNVSTPFFNFFVFESLFTIGSFWEEYGYICTFGHFFETVHDFQMMSEVCSQDNVPHQIQHRGVILARKVLKYIATLCIHDAHGLCKMMSLEERFFFLPYILLYLIDLFIYSQESKIMFEIEMEFLPPWLNLLSYTELRVQISEMKTDDYISVFLLLSWYQTFCIHQIGYFIFKTWIAHLNDHDLSLSNVL